jgi:protein-L-isoaspartate(D-aspartate) O-methyltransferase
MMVIPVGDIGDQVLRLYKKESEDTYAIRDLAPVRFVPLLPDIAAEDDSSEMGSPEQLAWA